MTDTLAGKGEAAIPRLHDVKEVRRRLNIGLTKFYELINSGELRSVTIGRRRLVSEDALVEFIARLEAGTRESAITEEAA